MSLAISAARSVLCGGSIHVEDALELLSCPLEELEEGARMIRRALVPAGVELCSICSVHTGGCSEDCAFCAQSTRAPGGAVVDLDLDSVISMARRARSFGVARFSLVSSGLRTPGWVVDLAVQAAPILRDMGLSPCVSLGMLDRRDLLRLQLAGVERIHCNLEASPAFFPKVCSTHWWGQKMEFISMARTMGFQVCCGGIIGMGEGWEDRLALSVWSRRLGAQSFPVNVLDPIGGTPLEGAAPLPPEDFLRFVCVLRYIHPTARIRIAGGRRLIRPMDRRSLEGPVDSLMTGDYLTTRGVSFQEDLEMISSLGLAPVMAR
ncbi:biotin synthase BioB [Thermanaerovibrio acidaminovorans]|uniref:biotin synthase BioB n=1 Tax=Thermanaerovibrio acidaminovorans TaxID=81462 RepID=UPI0024914118|nr:biotin synthase BioB [Thermanaerovibrio acidaminovorans]